MDDLRQCALRGADPPTVPARATLRTPKGTFTAPDYLIDFRVLAGPAPAHAAAGGG